MNGPLHAFSIFLQLSVALGCRRQTNNAVRTTAVTNMLQSKEFQGLPISEREILGVTGQHASATISHYDRTGLKRRFIIADAIMRIPERNVPPDTTASQDIHRHDVDNLLKDQENIVIVSSKFWL